MTLNDYWSLPPDQQEQVRNAPPSPNPCVNLYGPGPADKQCKDCSHLIKIGGHARDYIKCDLRKITNGAGSDHRVSMC